MESLAEVSQPKIISLLCFSQKHSIPQEWGVCIGIHSSLSGGKLKI